MDAKRVASPSAKATAAPEAGSLKAESPPPPLPPGVSPAVAAPHRRSERHARAASVEKPDKSGDATDADGGGARRERRRTRGSSSPARGVASPPSTTPSSPVRSLSKTASAASADNSPALSSTPNRRRRPASRSSVVAMAGADTTSTASDAEKAQQTHRVLGKYAARECTLLCEVILDHVRRNALAGDVLERQHSPACIRWDKVAKRMVKMHRLVMTARECQVLWKFLAYAEAPEDEDRIPTGSSDVGDAELLPASDEEDIERPIHEIQATQRGIRTKRSKERARVLSFTSGSTLASPRGVSSHHAAVQGADNDGTAGTITEEGAAVDRSGTSKPRDNSAASASTVPSGVAAGVGGETSDPVALSATASPSKRSDGIQLYPTYELPRGSLDGWQRPFDIKKMLPLSFVAEKFLKKRAAPIVKPPSTTATPAVKVETKVEASVSVSSGNQALVTATTTARTMANTAAPASSTMQLGNPAAIELQAATMVKKRPVSTFSPNSTTAGAKPAKKKKTQPIKPVSTSSINQPRAPFVPSTTPPPAPTPAKTALDFFRLVHARLNEGAGAANPSQQELTTFFQAAAPAIQEECKKLALIDLDRFNRECVRRRIWEKAMGAVSQSNSPLVSPAVASAASAATGVNSNSGAVLPTGEGITGKQSGLVQTGSTPQGGGKSASSS